MGALAAENGFHVYIGTHHAIHEVVEQKKIRAGLFLDKGGQTLKWQSMRKKTEYLGVLDQELSPILTDAEHIQQLLPLRFINGNEELVNLMYVVGNAYYQEALEFFGSKTTVINSGWPRIDLWRPPFSGAYSETAGNIVNTHGEFLLFSSDFGTTSESQLKTQLGLIESKNATEHEKKYYREIQVRKALSDFNKTVEIIRFWDEDPRIPQIIVRPHPADNFRDWNKSLQGLKKTKVIHEGEINSWVEASQGVIHRGCTTALHAYMLGKPVFFLKGCGDSRQSELPYLISLPVGKDQGFSAFYQEGNGHRVADPRVISNFITFNTESACKRIIDTWIDLEMTPEPLVSPLRHFIRSLTFRNGRRRIGLLKWELLWIIRRTAYEPPSQVMKGGIRFKDFGLVLKFINNNKIILKRVGRNLWLITSRF